MSAAVNHRSAADLERENASLRAEVAELRQYLGYVVSQSSVGFARGQIRRPAGKE